MLLLKLSGCVAVSGGLEVASDRLLKLINKGVSVSQVAKVTRNFTEAGIMVHSYLMYGYPTKPNKKPSILWKWFVKCSKWGFYKADFGINLP